MIKSITNDSIQWKCHCGTENTAHVSHNQLRWTGAQEITLPACSKCGASTMIHIPDDEELTPPIIAVDEKTGKILQMADAEHPKFSRNLWKKRSDIVRHPQPHPSLVHLSEGEIKELQTINRSKAPDIPVDWMLTETTREVIHEVSQHPAVALHRQLADIMKQNGKAYAEPGVVESTPQISSPDEEDNDTTNPQLSSVQLSSLEQ